ncbi:phospholipase D [Chaetomium sp. MPI-SDFR-AT-0129]|nr:phospholipase D [Chaetomium sp. MPI-SDFR-AT-0129]
MERNISTTSAQPFYMIAHRVLTVQGVNDALSHGANALEIDMTAWSDGWYADHDGGPASWGDTAEAMFTRIRQQHDAGKTILFVWLDIKKDPDHWDPQSAESRHSSIDGLRDLARKHLASVGIRILYGFYDATSKAYVRIRDNLINEEAINLNGRVEDVAPAFAKGPEARSKKVMSYGYYNLPFQFGNGHENRYYTCTELRMAAQSNEYGKVFGWTSAAGQGYYVDKLLGEAGIDGLIYGFKMTYYYDHENTRAAAGDIISWVRNHPEKRFIAGKGDFPW